jgi:hypothetical protein
VRRLAVAALAAVLLCAAAWQLWGSEHFRGGGLGPLRANADAAQEAPTLGVLQVMVCRDWQEADGVRRRVIVAALHSVLGGDVTGIGFSGRAKVLEDQAAERLFDAHCAHDYAESFLLYKLYGQAAGFAGVAP